MSMQEAADHLGVHYMTVYRYVRLGRLPASKVGGTWVVAVDDLEKMGQGPSTSDGRGSVDWSGRLEARLIEGDEAGAWGVVEGAMASGSSPTEIYTEVIGPALASVGDRWHVGELSVADEHIATSVALRLIGRLGPRFARKGRSKGSVVIATPPGERHLIPSLMVADHLRAAGFDVIDLGGDVPVGALSEIVGKVDGLVAVCISATRAESDGALRRVVKAMRRSVPGVPVFVGGGSISDLAQAESVGADGWAADGPGAVDLVLGVVS